GTVAGCVGIEKDRVFRIGHTDPAVVALVAYITPYGCCGAARTATADDPVWHRVGFLLHLAEDGFGNIVIAAPVRRPFRIGELIHVMPAQLARQAFRLAIDLASGIHQVNLSAIILDRRDL